MGSELCTFHIKKFMDFFTLKSVVDTTHALLTLPDFEYSDEARADMVPPPKTYTSTVVLVGMGENGTDISRSSQIVETFEMPAAKKPQGTTKEIYEYIEDKVSQLNKKQDPEGPCDDNTKPE